MAESTGEVDAALDAALDQIRGRGHADKYHRSAKSIHLIGIAFGREARNLLEIRAERVEGEEGRN